MFDVRSHELTAVVSLNGANRTLALDVNATPETTPGAVATFQTNLTLSKQINTIEVSATDPNRRWAPDYDDANATTGRDILRLDGDGLPDTYEENVTGTDPLDPDSNATQTAQNESSNNISDGAEDLDGDGETAYEAYRFGLDPLDNDTDDDRLLDGFELQFRGLDPATNDTDNDSVADPAEDLDNDTLSNYREQNASTNPVRADTDLDGLNDSEEVANGTDPLAPDTDSDGLTDPDEYEVGTDPLDNDTDDDGVLDGNETFSTSKTDAKTGVSINITGKGNVASTLSINNSTEPMVQTDSVKNVSASDAYDFEAKANFSTANITLPYNESRVGDANESNLGAYRYNETLQTLVPVNNSTVDTRNDTVTAETSHFSTYTVLSTEKWESKFDEPLPSKWSNSDNFSDLDRWRQDGNVSMGTAEDMDASLVSATRSENDTDDNSTAVVGSVYRITERNWTIPKDKETTRGDETTTTTTTTTSSGTTTTGTVSSQERCFSFENCEPTETTTTTTEEAVTTQDPYEDSDGDETYDRNDDCPDKPGEAEDGCEKHSDDDGIRDWNDDCDDEVGEGDGCPTDSDDDGTINYNDECENTPGLRDDGCTIHSDKDDENDYNDDCPEEPGTGADGCPIDDDGDDTRNFYDNCPEFPGWKDNGCPRESNLERTVTLRDAETITLGTVARANAVSKRSVAQLVVVGPNGERIEVYGEDRKKISSSNATRLYGILPGGEGDAHGDFEAVEQDLSEFAGEEVTIKVETVGKATFEIDALKIGYDTDGDTIYDAIERPSCGLRDGSGQCLDTDPYLADTDGDGLSDSYEIGERKRVHGHEYTKLYSNPTVRDTDGDGLTDYQEVRGSFEMAVTRDPEASSKYLNGQWPSDKREHLYTKTVDSDPLEYDTDDDGLNDRQEWLYKTNPRNSDSDGDGRLDGREQAIGQDPTLHDYRGPDIRLKRYGTIANYSSGELKYVVEYFVFDGGGVKKTKVTRNGETRYRASPDDLFSRHDGSFTTTPDRLSVDGGRRSGIEIKVSATDTHGNTESVTAVRRSNECGQAAKRWTGKYNYFNESAVRAYGTCSGFQASIGASIESILTFVENPLAFAEGLARLVTLLNRSGLLDMFINAFVSDLQNKQKTNNPYPEGTETYEEYRSSWYAGYSIAFITKALYGGSATKALRSTKYVTKVEDFAKATRAGKTAMRVKAPYDRGKARVATGLAQAGGKAAGPILRRAKSAGAAYRLWKLQRKGGVDVKSLSKTERERVTEYLARHGKDGATDLRWMDDEDFDALFRKACSSRISTFERAGDDCAELDEIEQDGYEDAVVDAGVDPDQFDARLEQLEINEGSAKRVFYRTGTPGVKIASKLDDKVLNQFVQLDARTQRMLVKAWRTDREVSGGKIGSDGLDIMVRQGADVRDLSRASGLSTDDTCKLLRAYGRSSGVSEGPLDDADDLQSALENLADDDVDGLDEAVEDISGTETGYKGIAGEADISNGLKGSNNNIDADDLQMEYDVEVSELPEEVREKVRKSGKFKTGTDIDVKVDGELTVDGKTMDSPAIESKNWKPNPGLPPKFRNDDINDLENKLSTYAVSGEDEIIVVMEKDTIEELDGRLKKVEGNVNEALDSLDTNADTPDEITIEFISYNELSE
ncbi:hypothetical protein [Halorussus lipolyticus]|uniref:hypothetical protein n=1 Tax=Halorussus lipolyticus TaxID=3034024 RepID=UPI0023E85E6E|nr:hypothetical protein [Halorussus sp. DT80]